MEKLEIDTKRLKSELLETKKYYEGNPNSDDIRNDYLNFRALANRYSTLTHESVLADATYDMMLFEYLKADYIKNSSRIFCSYLNRYIDFVNAFLIGYSYAVKKIGLINTKGKPLDKVYSLHEFKDILLDYYSSIGETEYKIAKKYLDEGRIQAGDKNDKVLGSFLGVIHEKYGYIFAGSDRLDSSLMSTLAHELGHAIDYEKYYFSSNKMKDSFTDLFSEVPSTYHEIGMLKFLKENSIDEIGARLLLQEIYNYILKMSKRIGKVASEVSRYGEINVKEDGTIKLHDGTDVNIRYDMKYSLSNYLVLFLLSKDRDKKETVKMMNEALSKRYESTIYDFLKNVNVQNNELMCANGITDDIIENNSVFKKKYM